MLGRTGRVGSNATRPQITHSLTSRRFTLPRSKPEYIKQNPYAREFPSSLSQAGHILRRTFKLSAVGALSISSAAVLLFHGAHLYVEKVSLAPENYLSNPHTIDISQFGWNEEYDNWTGSPDIGGTDPKLSWKARQAIRSAWMSFNWSITAIGDPSPNDPSAYDTRLISTLRYLEIALRDSSELEPQVKASLLSLQGNVAGSFGSLEALQFAETHYRAALDCVIDSSPRAAKLLNRLADVLTRLGRSDEAIETYWKSVRIIDPERRFSEVSLDQIPYQPAAQRLLLRNLTAMSALYSSTRDLKSAHAFQRASLDLAQRVISDHTASASSSGALHNLYLQQQIATLKIHHAEVIYAMKQGLDEAVELLSSAASISEQTALALSDKDKSIVEQSGPAAVLEPADSFKTSKVLSLSANSLLLEASRSAATTFRFLALLQEKHNNQGLLGPFSHIERALWWCGGIEGSASNIPVAEWEMVWKDYKRIRELTYSA